MCFCTSCGQRLVEGQPFCTGCGAPATTSRPPRAHGADDVTVGSRQPGSNAATDIQGDADSIAPDESGRTAPWAAAARPGPLGEKPARRTRRTRRRRGSALLVGALLLACGGGAFLLIQQEPTPAATLTESGAAASETPLGLAPPSQRTPETPGPAGGTDTASSQPTSAPADVAPRSFVEVPEQAPDGVDGLNRPVSYGPENLTDGDPSTCWRMEGDGAGQVLTFNLSERAAVGSLGLVNGYAKTDPRTGEDRYRQERRVLRVTWLFDDGQQVQQTLRDGLRSPQRLELPTPIDAARVSLRIDGTTAPGDARFDYTALSSVSITAQ